MKPDIHGGEIDERLERRARLARRLDGAVELAAAVGPAARHGEHAAGLGVHHHHAAFDIGHLAQRIGLGRIRLGVLAGRLLDLLDHDHVAHGNHIARRARRRAEPLLGQGRRGPGHLGERQRALAIRQADQLHHLRLDLAHHGELPARRPGQRPALGDAGELLLPHAHVGDLGVGAAPAVAAVVGDQAVAQRVVGDRLDGRIERGRDGEPAFIEALLAVGRHQVAAHFLGEEVGLHDLGVAAAAVLQLLGLGLLHLGRP